MRSARQVLMRLARTLSFFVACCVLNFAQAQNVKVERGKYMVLTGHCNNCHTAGYAQREGNVPEKDWVMGSGVQGWRGPWGTTYASNLRGNVHAMSEEGWVAYIKNLKARPPLPWWSTKTTTEEDLRPVY